MVRNKIKQKGASCLILISVKHHEFISRVVKDNGTQIDGLLQQFMLTHT